MYLTFSVWLRQVLDRTLGVIRQAASDEYLVHDTARCQPMLMMPAFEAVEEHFRSRKYIRCGQSNIWDDKTVSEVKGALSKGVMGLEC